MKSLSFKINKKTTKLKLPWQQPARVYIVEFFVVQVSLLALYIVSTQLFSKFVDSFSDDSDGLFSLFAPSFELEWTLSLVAAGVVFGGLFFVLGKRVVISERKSKKLLASRRRRTLLYIVMSLVALLLITVLISFVYSLLAVILAGDTIDRGEAYWQSLLNQLFSLGFGGLILNYMAKSAGFEGLKR